MKNNNQNKEILYSLSSRTIPPQTHSEEENENLKKINNKYNLNLDYKSENIKISHYDSFDDEQLQKLLSINFENIRNLELSYNNITTINPLRGYENWYTLATLNLSNNRITQIEDLYYCDMAELEELDLSNNKIEYIDSLNNLKNLRKVNISSNNIKPDQERQINILKGKEIEVIQ
jgi:Leucine-rich repeat (LRR) protein